MAQFICLQQIVAVPIVFEIKSTFGFSPTGDSLFETKEDGARIYYANNRRPFVVDAFLSGTENNQITFGVTRRITWGKSTVLKKGQSGFKIRSHRSCEESRIMKIIVF